MMNELTNPEVTISILTYNRCEVLKTLLISLRNIKYKPLEIIVIDNHSQDGTQEMINAEFNQVRYIRTENNIGTSARNIGMKEAKGEIIITLDDDIIGITDQHIHFLIDRFRAEPELCAMNFKIRDFKTKNICNWVHHCRVEECSDTEFLTYEITEGAVAFRAESLRRAGYYPEIFFISHEGPDLALRLMNKGYQVKYSPEVEVEHHHSNLGRESWLNYYYDTRNLLWLAVRNYPFMYGVRYVLRGLLSMGLYSIRDRHFKTWLKAVFDSVKNIRVVVNGRNELTEDTMKIIKEIDSHRPDIMYLLKNRLFSKGARL